MGAREAISVTQGQRDDDDGADRCGEADIEIERETEPEIKRHPRQVEQRRRPQAGEEVADGVEIANRLEGIGRPRAFERQLDAPRHRPCPRSDFVEGRADPDQHPRPDQVENGLERIEAQDDQRQPDQGRHALARQHAIVNLQHEDRAAEHEQIDECRKEPDARKALRNW